MRNLQSGLMKYIVQTSKNISILFEPKKEPYITF
jgi:hypothetical protein